MELSIIIFNQTLMMAVYMLAGYVLYKAGKINEDGSRTIATLLVWLIIPSTIIHGFCVEFTMAKLQEFGVSFLLGFVALLIALVIARLVFPKNPVDNFSAAFSNAGFIGIPLVQASIGDQAVFYLVGMIAALNLLQWTYGGALLKGEKVGKNVSELFLNPIVVGSLAGFLVFVLHLGDRLPSVLSGAITGLAALNSPLAMLVLGVYLAQTRFVSLLVTPRLYLVSFIRLLLIPAVTLLVFRFMPGSEDMKLTLLIAAAAPVGANVAVYAQLYDKDYSYACETVTQSTVLSIVTLPLFLLAAKMLLG